MAAGDLVSCTIGSLGFTANIALSGLGVGGAFAFGFDAVAIGKGGDPTNSKIRFRVTSLSYDGDVATTKVRTVYGVPDRNVGAVRLVYPNQGSPDESNDGSVTLIRVALSDHIYASDIVALDIDAGWYTYSGTSSRAASSLACTNSSTLAYPKVLGGWATEQYMTIRGSSLHVEFAAFHKFAEQGRQVPLVKFVASDGTHTATYMASSMSISSDSPLGKIIVYQADFDLTNFTDLANVTVNATAYPWVGSTAACLDTGDGVNTMPTRLYTPLLAKLDKLDVHGKTCVDASAGNDSTGAVYATQAAAEAGNAFATIAAALTALQTYNNTHAGHNDAGGGWIYLKAGSHTINSSNGGTVSRWVNIAAASTATASTVSLTPAAGTSLAPNLLRLVGLTFISTGSYMLLGNTNNCIAFSGCAMNISSGYVLITTPKYSSMRNCTGTLGATTGRHFCLLRGNDMLASGVEHSVTPYVMLGNRGMMPDFFPASASTVDYNDGGCCAFNRIGDLTVATSVNFANSRNVAIGMAYVQNVIVRYTNNDQPVMMVAGDGNTATSTNILFHHNTLVGGRINCGYNDTNVAAHYHNGWSEKNNIWACWNNKDDTFGSSTTAVGSWPVGYAVGRSGSVIRRPASDEWLGESSGLYFYVGSQASPLDPQYVNDQSFDGGNTSGGDYHLKSTSPAIGLAHDLVLPFDFEGNARYSGGAVGAYEYGTPHYGITYDPNGATGGSVPVDSSLYAPGSTVPLAINSGGLIRSGYSLAGWNASADGSGTHYVLGGSLIMGNSNIKIYAEWSFIIPPSIPVVSTRIGAKVGKIKSYPGYTKRQIIQDALGELGITSYSIDLPPDQIEQILHRLDSMIAEWNARGIRLGYPLSINPRDSNISDDSGIPDWAWSAAVINLAIQIAPSFGKTVSPQTLANARSSLNTVMARSVRIPESRLGMIPAGAGNRRQAFIPTPENDVLENPDPSVDIE